MAEVDIFSNGMNLWRVCPWTHPSRPPNPLAVVEDHAKAPGFAWTQRIATGHKRITDGNTWYFSLNENLKIHWLSRNQSHVEYPKIMYTHLLSLVDVAHKEHQFGRCFPTNGQTKPLGSQHKMSFHPPRYTFDIRLTRMMKHQHPSSYLVSCHV